MKGVPVRRASLLWIACLAASVAGCCLGGSETPPPIAPAPLPEPEPEPAPPPPRVRRPPPAPPTPPPQVMERVGLGVPLDSADGITPMRPSAGALFDRARPFEGAVARGLLICRARVRGAFDDSFFAGGADVAMSLRVADRPWLSTPQSSARVFTMPLSEVEIGTALELNVVDRDVVMHDLIASHRHVFGRAPFTLETESATTVCRVMPDVSREASRATERYQQAIESVSEVTPRLAEDDLGFPSTTRVLDAAREAASWVGWTAPEMLTARARAGEIDRAFERRVGEAVVEAIPTLPAFGEPLRLRDRTIRIVRFACGEDAEAMRQAMGRAAPGAFSCLAVLEITARTRLTLRAVRVFESELWSLHTSGARDRAQRLAVRHGEVRERGDAPLTLTPGEVGLVHIGLSRPAPLLRIGAELTRTPTLVRLE